MGLRNVLECVVPVLEQIRFLVIVHTNVEVVEHAGEKVVDLAGDVEDVADTEAICKYKYIRSESSIEKYI